MDRLRLDLSFKGDRDYLQGGDVFNALLKRFKSSCPISLRFHRPIKFQVEAGPLGVGDNPAARFTYWNAGDKINLGLYEIAGAPVIERIPYDEDAIGRGAECDQWRVKMKHRPDATFIERVLVMNKLLHRALFPEAQGRWLFTRLELERNFSGFPQIALSHQSNLGSRLTKVRIEADGETLGDLFFTPSPP